MTTGEVHRINERGFFFIRPDEGGPDIFGHATRLQFPFDELQVGDRLEFDTERCERGLRASCISKIER